jgi:hypothetical protein
VAKKLCTSLNRTGKDVELTEMAAIHFRVAWSGDLLSLSLDSQSQPAQNAINIYQLKKKLTEVYGFRLDLIQLQRHGRVFTDSESIAQLLQVENLILDLYFLAPRDPPLVYQSYDPFISSIQFKTLSGDLVPDQKFPQNGAIEIMFCEDSMKNSLDLKKIFTENTSQRPADTNMIEIFGLLGAQER